MKQKTVLIVGPREAGKTVFVDKCMTGSFPKNLSKYKQSKEIKITKGTTPLALKSGFSIKVCDIPGEFIANNELDDDLISPDLVILVSDFPQDAQLFVERIETERYVQDIDNREMRTLTDVARGEQLDAFIMQARRGIQSDKNTKGGEDAPMLLSYLESDAWDSLGINLRNVPVLLLANKVDPHMKTSEIGLETELIVNQYANAIESVINEPVLPTITSVFGASHELALSYGILLTNYQGRSFDVFRESVGGHFFSMTIIEAMTNAIVDLKLIEDSYHIEEYLVRSIRKDLSLLGESAAGLQTSKAYARLDAEEIFATINPDSLSNFKFLRESSGKEEYKIECPFYYIEAGFLNKMTERLCCEGYRAYLTSLLATLKIPAKFLSLPKHTSQCIDCNLELIPRKKK